MGRNRAGLDDEEAEKEVGMGLILQGERETFRRVVTVTPHGSFHQASRQATNIKDCRGGHLLVRSYKMFVNYT